MLGKKSGQHLLRAYIRARQMRLMQRVLAPWPRRSSPLLEINCGAGDFLNFLWQNGFDIAAIESDARLAAKARKKCGNIVDINPGKDDSLPYEADSFDWVILHLKDHSQEAIARSAQEALRVTSRGLMISFWNRASLPFALRNLIHQHNFPETIAVWKVWKALSSVISAPRVTMSAFHTPCGCWSEKSLFSHLDDLLSPLPFGAWVLVRFDLGAPVSVTPLGLRLDRKMAPPQPALEYVHKDVAPTLKK